MLHVPSRSLLGPLAVALLALGVTDCHEPDALKAKDPTVSERDPQSTTCSVAKHPLNPSKENYADLASCNGVMPRIDQPAQAERQAHQEQQAREQQRASEQQRAQQERPAREALLGRMVLITGGSFLIGSAGGEADEKSVHKVTVASFEMDTTEVTTAAYGLCAKQGGCTQPDQAQYCNWGVSGRENHPINCVDWDQATAFCRWAEKRLPTEEEWEYAARPGGAKEGRYPWGDSAPGDQLCWGRLGSGKPNSTCEVGSFPAGNTSTGLKDMAGNVWEWTSSQYCPYTPSGYDMDNCMTARVVRGGGWVNGSAAKVRGASRFRDMPAGRSYGVGFRCARSI